MASIPVHVVGPAQASSLPGGHDQSPSQIGECVAAVCQPAPFSPRVLSPVAVVSRGPLPSSLGWGHAQAPGHEPLPVIASSVSTEASHRDARSAQGPGIHKPLPVTASGVGSEASHTGARSALGPGSQSPPVTATSVGAGASSREAAAAPATGGQPGSTSVRAAFSPREDRVTPAPGESSAAESRDTFVLDGLGGAFPASCHRASSQSLNCGASGFP